MVEMIPSIAKFLLALAGLRLVWLVFVGMSGKQDAWLAVGILLAVIVVWGAVAHDKKYGS